MVGGSCSLKHLLCIAFPWLTSWAHSNTFIICFIPFVQWQRISGSSIQSGLQFFGISLSQSSPDQSKDGLPDIAVGSMGAVLLLRSVLFHKVH